LKITLKEPLFAKLGALADDLNVPCYAVGGYVRDKLMEKPCKDIDVMIVGEPIEFAKAVKSRLNGFGFAVFERFRTAQLHLNDEALGELKIEFVGARKESYNPDSRKPITEIGTLEDDLSRRDFTVNALAISLNAATYGELIDLFGGLDDIKQKCLRTPLEPESTCECFVRHALRRNSASRLTRHSCPRWKRCARA